MTFYSGPSDPHGGPSAAPDAWIAHIAAQNPVDAPAILAAYQANCGAVNYSADLALAQACLETGTFTSPAWRSRQNPAGIGITGDNVAGPNFGSIEDGVRAHLELLNCYFGDGRAVWGVLARFGLGGFTEGFTRLNQMNGVWAVPGTTYGETIAGIANAVIGGVAPQPGPSPVPSSGVTLAMIRDIARDHIGKTLTDEGVPEFGMCEQEFEEWCEEAGLPRTRYASAAEDGDVRLMRGEFHTEMPPPPGAGLIWGRRFDAAGHICAADDYPFVITTYPGMVSRINAVANGWYGSPGFLGWFIPEGATLAQEDDTMFTVDGKIDPGRLDVAWYGRVKPTATQMRTMPRVVGNGIPDRWEQEFRKGKNIGPVLTREMTIPGSGGAKIQYFVSGWICWYPDGSTSVS